MTKKCYEINNCPFNTGKVPPNAKCPPFESKIGCWEYDWVSFYNKMPECKEKLQWKDSMISRCKQCVVYSNHEKEMDSILNKLGN